MCHDTICIFTELQRAPYSFSYWYIVVHSRKVLCRRTESGDRWSPRPFCQFGFVHPLITFQNRLLEIVNYHNPCVHNIHTHVVSHSINVNTCCIWFLNYSFSITESHSKQSFCEFTAAAVAAHCSNTHHQFHSFWFLFDCWLKVCNRGNGKSSYISSSVLL